MKYGNRPIGIFDLTNECPLRCKHCYYYTNVSRLPRELDDHVFLTRLKKTRDQYNIRSAFWIGGEPLVKPELLRRALEFFPRNAVATSGAVSIPTDLDAGLLVSIDGPEEAHDALRGEGAFATAMANIAPLRPRSFALATTITAATVDYIGALPELVTATRAQGVLVGFHVGRPDDPSRVDDERRDEAVDQLLEIHRAHPGAMLQTREAIELLRPRHSARLAKKCIYRDTAIAFDVRLGVKRPCTFAGNADCDACGCPIVATHAAWRGDDVESGVLLHVLFPKRQALASGA
ncbi:MAG: radical SAM protein [Candidatus Krumholzibacteria bacterium]